MALGELGRVFHGRLACLIVVPRRFAGLLDAASCVAPLPLQQDIGTVDGRPGLAVQSTTADGRYPKVGMTMLRVRDWLDVDLIFKEGAIRQ